MMQEALDALQDILDLLDGTACPISPPACRTTLYPGPEVPWDTCEVAPDGSNGQVWANLIATPTVVQEGGCAQITFEAEIGVVRCAAPPKDDGSPPSPAAVAADAAQQAADADSIWRAVSCCPERTESIRSMMLVSWRPIGSGGCVGGIWRVRGVLHDCC